MEKETRFWKITPVLTGSFGMVRDDIKYQGGDSEVSEYVPSVLFLLESDGEQVVVDTGFGDEEQCRERTGLFIRREKPLEIIFSNAGIEKERVRYVILTHLHWDHIGNVSMFPYAQYYCQKKEWIYAQEHPEEYTEYWMKYLRERENRMFLVGDSQNHVVLPGIEVQHIGGHTTGSQMVLVQTKQGLAVITGDTVMTYRNIKEDVPIGLCTNKAECLSALELIAKMKPTFIFPSHDYLVFGKEGGTWGS